MAAIFFTYNEVADRGHVAGAGWNTYYHGCGGAVATWSAANRDGFILAPGETFNAFEGRVTRVVLVGTAAAVQAMYAGRAG